MEIELPQEFIVRREIYAIQLFGRNLLEQIPPGAVILAECLSTYIRMTTYDRSRLAREAICCF